MERWPLKLALCNLKETSHLSRKHGKIYVKLYSCGMKWVGISNPNPIRELANPTKDGNPKKIFKLLPNFSSALNIFSFTFCLAPQKLLIPYSSYISKWGLLLLYPSLSEKAQGQLDTSSNQVPPKMQKRGLCIMTQNTCLLVFLPVLLVLTSKLIKSSGELKSLHTFLTFWFVWRIIWLLHTDSVEKWQGPTMKVYTLL